MSYAEDRAWSDRYLPIMRQLIGPQRDRGEPPARAQWPNWPVTAFRVFGPVGAAA